MSSKCLFLALRSYVCYFGATLYFKLELPTGNAQIGAISLVFQPVWPWTLPNDLEKQKGTSSMLTSCVHNFAAIVEFNLESGNAKFKLKKNQHIFVPCDLEIWRMTLKNIRGPLPSYVRLCASFCNHRWIQTGVTGEKRWIFVPCELEIWQMTLGKYKASLLTYFKLLYTLFRSHYCILTGVTVRD